MEGLPEGCISHILSLTSPQDACRSSAVSVNFQSAAGSDSVWEKFLPSDYKEILSDSVTPVHFSTKKELYDTLCQFPILLHGGTKSFQLEKKSGKKCYMLGARDLYICWGDTPRYWDWTSVPESRFPEVARLLDVCWLEIEGKMKTKMLSPNTTYVACLVYMLDEDSEGFENCPINVSVALNESILTQNTIYVNTGGRWEVEVPKERAYVPQERGDGWMEIQMGEFTVDDDNIHDVVQLRFWEYGVNWKSGLIVQDNEGSLTTACLNVPRCRPQHGRNWWSRSFVLQDGVQLEQARGDGWKEVKLGEFFNDGHGEVEMRFREI